MYFEISCRVFELSICGSQAPLGTFSILVLPYYIPKLCINLSLLCIPFNFFKLTHIQPAHRNVFWYIYTQVYNDMKWLISPCRIIRLETIYSLSAKRLFPFLRKSIKFLPSGNKPWTKINPFHCIGCNVNCYRSHSIMRLPTIHDHLWFCLSSTNGCKHVENLFLVLFVYTNMAATNLPDLYLTDIYN